MQATLETADGLTRRLLITIPSNDLESKVEDKLKETARSIHLKGFRPGKVPVKEIRRRFGDGIRQEVGGELVQSAYGEAIQEQQLTPAGMPQIEDLELESGKDLAFTAIFEIFPEITLSDYSTVSIAKPVCDITEPDIDKMVENLREQRKSYNEVDRACVADDQLNIDFDGSVDDAAFAGGSGEGHTLVVGAGTMLKDFEDALIGASAGAALNADVTFPEDYQNTELAGKAAVFKIKVNSVSEQSLPKLDGAFFEQFGVTDGDMDAFRTEVKSNMERELAASIKNRIKSQVMDGLSEINSIEVPKALVTTEIDRMRQEMMQQFGGGQQFDPSILPADMFESRAEKRVALGLLVNELVSADEIEVDDDRVRSTIEEMASSYEEPEQLVNWYYQNDAQLEQIRNMVLEDQVVDTLLAKASVTDEAMEYEEAIKPPPQPAIDEPADEPVKAQEPSGDNETIIADVAPADAEPDNAEPDNDRTGNGETDDGKA